LLFHFTRTKALCQIPKDKSLHHSKCLLIMWNISNFDEKFWLFCFISSNNGKDNVSKISFFSFISHLAMELWSGKLNIKSRSTGFWSVYKQFSCHTRVPDICWPMKNGDSSTCLACIVYNWEVNSRDDNKQLVMGGKNRCRHQSSRKTVWPTSHSDFLSCRIQESECKFTGPNKNKNNFTCLLLYQFADILSEKYQAFPAVVAFNQWLPIFHFLF
jgi:hypothetical protein